MAIRIQLRRDTATNWTSANPILAQGEVGVEIDVQDKVKIGDGVTDWINLPYFQAQIDATSIITTAAGNNTEIQYNDNDLFGASPI